MIIGIDASRAFGPLRTGTENYSYNLIKSLAKIDKQNQYKLYVRNSHFAIPNFKTPNSKIKFPKNFEFIKIFLPRFWTQLGLAAECFLHPPDVLFIPAHTLPLIRRPNLKTVVTIHDLGAEFLPGFYTFPQRFYLNWSTEYAVEAASAIIAVSSATKKDLIEKLKAKPDKIFVVAEGIDKKRFTVDSSQFTERVLKKYKIRKPYILFVGTVQPRKNLERLIQAFALIAKRLTSNDQRKKALVFSRSALSLVIVGKFGWLYDEILAAPKKFEVGDQVKFLGYVSNSDLAAIYSQAELFVMPSLVEGFGLPVLEAMAAGIPTVVSKTSSLPEVAGAACVYFNPEKVPEIASAILKVCKNPNLRKSLIEKGKRQVAKFSWERTAGETLKVFERVYKNEN